MLRCIKQGLSNKAGVVNEGEIRRSQWYWRSGGWGLRARGFALGCVSFILVRKSTVSRAIPCSTSIFSSTKPAVPVNDLFSNGKNSQGGTSIAFILRLYVFHCPDHFSMGQNSTPVVEACLVVGTSTTDLRCKRLGLILHPLTQDISGPLPSPLHISHMMLRVHPVTSMGIFEHVLLWLFTRNLYPH